MLKLTQNDCVICLESGETFNPLLHKASYFGCNCLIYFHNKCWTAFLSTDNKCPYCRLIRREPINSLYLLVKKYNIFLLLIQILISPACVLYTIGLTQLKSSDYHFSDIVIITSTTYLDFIITFITDCNTGLLLYENFRKLFLVFNIYKFFICIVSIIIISPGNLNNYTYIIYGTWIYISSYFLVFFSVLITVRFTN
jgi:hypothetical protein